MTNKNAPQSDTSTRQYIFQGVSFVGPAVSKEEYSRHYEEYLKRVSGTTTTQDEIQKALQQQLHLLSESSKKAGPNELATLTTAMVSVVIQLEAYSDSLAVAKKDWYTP